MANKNHKKTSVLIGFNKRKILLFSLVFALFFIGVGTFRKLSSYRADESSGDYVREQTSQEININIEKDGNILVDGKVIKQKIDMLEENDELRLLIMDNSGEYFDNIKATVTFPEAITSNVAHEFLAIHGVDEATSSIISENQILFQASGVSSQATLTVVAKMPKGTISPPLERQLLKNLLDIKKSFWLILAVLLPFLTLVFMFALIFSQSRQQKIENPKEEINAPPMAIPAAIVGALFRQKVGPREIAATLVDLALRGDIVIVDRERGFEFGKNRFDQRLLGFEKILLSKIFKSGIFSDRNEIDERINNHFYSRKISLVSAGVYILATRLGYFKENPQSLHAKYRFIGILAFFVSLAGFVLSLLIFTDPPYAVFFWVGMMIAALVSSLLASYLPIRTEIGRQVLSNWLAFKKFLSNPEPISFAENNQEMFQKYLPYAIVLDCEAAWARRFSKHNFFVPDWFITDKIGLGLEDFCLSLFPIISYVGRSFAALKEPGFE